MAQHTPILMNDRFLSAPISVESTPRKRRRYQLFAWSGVAVLLSWLTLLIG